MIELITDFHEIDKCHRILKSRFDSVKSERLTILIGFQGDNVKARVNYSDELGIWWYTRNDGATVWNPFGLDKPSTKSSNSITCEINYARSAPPTSRAGAFGRDDSGKVVLLHSGRIGGGRKGIGQSLFFSNFVGETLEVKMPNGRKRYAPVGALNSVRFPYQIALFVKEISRIKQSAIGETSSFVVNAPRNSFNEEFAGTKRYEHKRTVEANCDHGLVVNALRQILKHRGFQTANDTNRDLYIQSERGEILTVFEFKMDATSQSLYTGVGQLLLNNWNLSTKPNLVMVLPSRLTSSAGSILKSLGIQTLNFSWKNDKPIFTDLAAVLRG